MDKQSLIFQLIDIYKNYIEKESIYFSGSDFVFQLKEDKFDSNKSTLYDLFESLNSLPERKISLKFTNTKVKNLHVFYKKDDFLKSKSYLENFEAKSILILDEDLLYKLENEDFSKEKALIFNNYAYQNILSFLKKNQLFSTLKSNNNEFIVVSKENSVMHIGYRNIEPRLQELDNIYPQFQLLKKRFEKVDLNDEKSENIEFIKLFIENISTAGFGNNKEKKEDSLFEIVRNLNILTSLTERDYENYIKNFSFEKIKSKFKDERNKYFEGLEKNIDLISKQVVSFPLTFAATAFASYQVKDKPFILILVFIAYLLYTIIAFKILGITSYNIKCLGSDIHKEETDIQKSFNKNFEDFKDDFDKIKNKTEKIKKLLLYLKIILILMISLFSGHVIYQVLNDKNDKVKNTFTISFDKINSIKFENIDVNHESKIMIIDTIFNESNTPLLKANETLEKRDLMKIETDTLLKKKETVKK